MITKEGKSDLNSMNVALIGCGLIGRKRVENLPHGMNLVGCYDINYDLSEAYSKFFKVKKFDQVEEICNSKDVDCVFIATPHSSLFPIARELLTHGKHLLIEKPGAINSKELKEVLELSIRNRKMVHIGYNHRFHPAIIGAFDLIEQGKIGEVIYMRGRYGHGGRIGYEKEWRANRQLSGGGELIDQGTHLIDLTLQIFGNIELDYAVTPTYFWNMDVEDNVFMSLKNNKGNIAFLHASCTEWKNKFSFEIFGKHGKIEIDGLGRSYGTEKLIYYKMSPDMGPPEIKSWDFEEFDSSWKKENTVFFLKCQENISDLKNLCNSIRVLEIVEEIYERAGKC